MTNGNWMHLQYQTKLQAKKVRHCPTTTNDTHTLGTE